MNDFDYDVYQKKKAVSGARHRVNGSKSKKCTLPSDYLTPAQRRKLNGEVFVMNLNEPITWDELRALPQDMAKEYVEHLHNVHKASVSAAAEMLGVDRATYRKFCNETGAGVDRKAGRRSKEDEEAWARFAGGVTAMVLKSYEPGTPAEPEKHSAPEKHTVSQPMQPESMTITLTGSLDQLAAYIKLLPMDGRLRMTVTLEQSV